MYKLLVIEDNPEVNENLCEILELAGYQVQGALNGKIGVQLAIDLKPDLILCDVMMPELDGFGVLKILNSQKSTFDIPFIFLTAKVEHVDMRKGMSMGADDYITKPFDDALLLESIEIRLKKRARPIISNNQEAHLFSKNEARRAIAGLIESCETLSYVKNEYVFLKGKYPSSVFYIKKGMVKASCTNDLGKTLMIDIYTAEDLCGWSTVLLRDKYSFTARTFSDCEIAIIPISRFQKLLATNDHLTKYLLHLEILKSRLYKDRMIKLAYGSVRQKVACAILFLVRKYNSDQLNELTVPNLREDLSHLAGVAKETLIRTISNFKNEELILIDRNKIQILQLEKLEGIC